MSEGSRLAVVRIALVGLVVALAAIAYFPFAWSPPRTVENQVTRTADGSLRFGESNYARTPEVPPWVPEVRASGTIQIQLEVNPRYAEGQGPMLILGSDYSHTDVAVQQYKNYLMVWLRRPGSTIIGEPPFAVPGVLQPDRWTRLAVILQRGDLRIDVDGTPRLAEHFPPEALMDWGRGRLALGDEVDSSQPWQGLIRTARVRTPTYDIDYAAPDALSIPPTYLYVPDHVEPFPPTSWNQWLRTILNMLAFIPVGLLVVQWRQPPVHRVPAIAFVATLAVVLAAGKFLFEDRHTSVGVVVLQVAGGLLGVVLAARRSR
jgi:Concanavalin A-like lectin/glucanases superfamily